MSRRRNYKNNFTSKENSVNIKEENTIIHRTNGVEFLGALIASLILSIGLAVIICTPFNVITSLIYIAPCFATASQRVAHYVDKDYSLGDPICKFHMTFVIITLLITILIIVYGYSGGQNKMINCTLAVYPSYELVYTILSVKVKA
mgnify:FL=1